MGINSHHRRTLHPRPAPKETGHRLATFHRRWSGEELRVTLAEYQGHPYIALRVWAPGSDGQLWPVKGKGVSVRFSEVAELGEVLSTVAAQLDALDQAEADSRHGHQGPGAVATGRPASAPFDEFDGDDF